MTKETRTKNQQTIADSFNYCVNGELAELIALEELRKIELENLRKIKLDELKKLEELRKLR
ncbi:hypothetical protein, partial [Klebsiella pneumoniae]|uniref:hypothetical protein n=1 Tax=Klebsiella pneumoniae TaxID=573 RepID=UPI003EE0DC10